MSANNGDAPARRETGVSDGKAEYFEDVVESGVDAKDIPTPIRNLLSKDFPLSKIDNADREYLRLLSKNVYHYARETRPPEESLLQGDVGAALLEDPDYKMEAIPEPLQAEIESSPLTFFARVSRGQSGWQQDKLNEGIQTQRLEDERNEDDSGGVLGGIF